MYIKDIILYCFHILFFSRRKLGSREQSRPAQPPPPPPPPPPPIPLTLDEIRQKSRSLVSFFLRILDTLKKIDEIRQKSRTLDFSSEFWTL